MEADCALSHEPGVSAWCYAPLSSHWQLVQTGVDYQSVLRADSKFTPEQLMGLSTLAVVAVLIVNVTYFGWAQPPGGATPSWQGCFYSYLFLFQLLNGIAFVLSMTAVVAVTLLPLSLPTHPRYAVWCGSVLVALSAGMLMVAFMFAGLVAVGWNAPSPMCAAVRCREGGVPCSLRRLPTRFGSFGNTSVFSMDQTLAKLNGFTSPALCFGNGSLNDVNLFLSGSNVRPPSNVLCAAQVRTAVTQTNGLSSSLNAYPQNLPSSSSPIANGSLSDLLQALDPQSYVPLNQLRYICYNDSLGGTSATVSGSSLCDTWAQGFFDPNPLSVSPSGAYLTAATLLASGGLLFSQDDIIISTAGITLSFGFFSTPDSALDSLPLPLILLILAVGFACCMLGLAILVGATHCSKYVHCHMQVLTVPPIRTWFRHLAVRLSSRVSKWGNHGASQA